MENAKWYQNWAGNETVILKVRVKRGFRYELGTDLGRDFYYVSPERLKKINSAIKKIKKIKK